MVWNNTGYKLRFDLTDTTQLTYVLVNFIGTVQEH
jgi:hypothetical protein